MALRPGVSVDAMKDRGAGRLPGLVGFRVAAVDEEKLVAELDIRPELLAPNGYLHAATVVALADTACGYGCLAHRYRAAAWKYPAADGRSRCYADRRPVYLLGRFGSASAVRYRPHAIESHQRIHGFGIYPHGSISGWHDLCRRKDGPDHRRQMINQPVLTMEFAARELQQGEGREAER